MTTSPRPRSSSSELDPIVTARSQMAKPIQRATTPGSPPASSAARSGRILTSNPEDCSPGGRFGGRMTGIEEFLDDFNRYPDCAWTKINRGFWEPLGNVHSELGWPVTEANYEGADAIAKRSRFFDGGFVDELLALIDTAPRPGLVLAMELRGWPDDNRMLGTPADPTMAKPCSTRIRSSSRPRPWACSSTSSRPWFLEDKRPYSELRPAWSICALVPGTEIMTAYWETSRRLS